MSEGPQTTEFRSSYYGSLTLDEEKAATSPAAFLKGSTKPKRLSLLAILVCLFVPWIEFSAVCALLTFEVSAAGAWVALLFIPILLLGGFAVRAWRTRMEEAGDTIWWLAMFLFAMSAVGWVAGLIIGKLNAAVMKPVFDFEEMALYVDVDPSKTGGQQLMDAGRVFFKPGSRLDISRSVGFKSGHVYCAAPVVSDGKLGAQESIDFWAVGVDCCSGTSPDFHCSGYNDPRAYSGLRLTDDGQRPFYRLAVQEAEAAFGIKATHPIFLHWMRDPTSAVDTFRDKAHKRLNVFIWSALLLQLFLAGSVLFVTVKGDPRD